MKRKPAIYAGLAIIIILVLTLFFRSQFCNRTSFLIKESLPEQEVVFISSPSSVPDKGEILPEQERVENRELAKIVLIGETLPEQESLPN